jgi:sulfopyruvate decarboxylase TPP-binding subunit
MIFNEHMHQQFAKNRAGDLTLQTQTEALFNMASYLEVVAPLKLIAEFQGVAVSTVETRVKIGRASGKIPKASEVRARKALLKKGM